MWSFKTATDTTYFEKTWTWHDALPRLLKEPCGFKTKDEFVTSLTKGVNYLGFNNGKFSAMVFGDDVGNETVEGHLYCPRQSDLDFLTAMITFAKNEALKQFQRVIVEIPPHHRTLHGLVLRAGFFDTGLFKMPGSQFYIATR